MNVRDRPAPFDGVSSANGVSNDCRVAFVIDAVQRSCRWLQPPSFAPTVANVSRRRQLAHSTRGRAGPLVVSLATTTMPETTRRRCASTITARSGRSDCPQEPHDDNWYELPTTDPTRPDLTQEKHPVNGTHDFDGRVGETTRPKANPSLCAARTREWR